MGNVLTEKQLRNIVYKTIKESLNEIENELYFVQEDGKKSVLYNTTNKNDAIKTAKKMAKNGKNYIVLDFNSNKIFDTNDSNFDVQSTDELNEMICRSILKTINEGAFDNIRKKYQNVKQNLSQQMKSGGRAMRNFCDGGKLKDPEKMDKFEREANKIGWLIKQNANGSFDCESNLDYPNPSIKQLQILAQEINNIKYKWVPSTDKRFFEMPDEMGRRQLEYGIVEIIGKLVPIQ